MRLLFLLSVILSPAVMAGSVTDALNSNTQQYGPLNSPAPSSVTQAPTSRVTASIGTYTATAKATTKNHTTTAKTNEADMQQVAKTLSLSSD